MLAPDDPMTDPANRALLRELATRLAASYTVMPGREADAAQWVDLAFKAAAPAQVRSA